MQCNSFSAGEMITNWVFHKICDDLNLGFIWGPSVGCESHMWKYSMVLTVLIFGLQNEDIIRKCYNQQLADAIAAIKGMYKVGFWCSHG